MTLLSTQVLKNGLGFMNYQYRTCVCLCVFQAFVVKVERDGQEVQLVQRTFEEFYELHSKMRLMFPSSRLPRYTQSHSHTNTQ